MSEDMSHEWAKEAAEDAERLWQISMAELIAALQQFEIAQPETRVVFDAERRRLQHFVDKLIAAKPAQMAAMNYRIRSAQLYASPIRVLSHTEYAAKFPTYLEPRPPKTASEIERDYLEMRKALGPE